jgi:hypothetical protein
MKQQSTETERSYPEIRRLGLRALWASVQSTRLLNSIFYAFVAAAVHLPI